LSLSLAVALALVLAGCSDDGASAPDGGKSDGGGPDHALADGLRQDKGPQTDSALPPCGAVPSFVDGKSPVKVLHVATTGSDTSGDGSQAKPLASITAAAKIATPGTAIRVQPGTYPGGITLKELTGSATAPIWIGGAPGAKRPVIDGGNEGIHLVKPRYVVLHDLELKGGKNNGVNCDDGSEYGNVEAARFVLFRGLYIHDVGSSGNQDCLKLSGLRDFVVTGSTFERCGGGGSGSGVDHVGCHRGLIARNTFRDLSANAVQCKGGSADLEIRWNLMKDAGQRAVNMGGSTGPSYFRPPLYKAQANAEAQRIHVIANEIVGANTPFAFVGCVDCLAAHNTIIDPEKWLLRILQETKTGNGYTFLPASKGRVENNIFYFRRSKISTYVNIGSNTSPNTFTFNNNLWYAQDTPASSKPTLPVTESNGVVGQDPAFSGASKGDYSIGAASPAAGKGKAIMEARGDLAGRCFKSPPAIGAHEVKP
jgi:hypothetical protein